MWTRNGAMLQGFLYVYMVYTIPYFLVFISLMCVLKFCIWTLLIYFRYFLDTKKPTCIQMSSQTDIHFNQFLSPPCKCTYITFCLSVCLSTCTQGTLYTTTTVYGVLVHQEGAICATKAQNAPWCTRENLFVMT